MGKRAVFAQALMLWGAGPALAADPCLPGTLRIWESRGVLELRLDGEISIGTAGVIAGAFFDRNKRVKAVTLSLNSCGGAVDYMELVVHILEQIKATHPLTTKVERGDRCSSACVPVFLVGTRRVGALSSVWYFHPVTQYPKPPAKPVSVPAATEDVIHRYFLQAGVSPD